MQNYELAYTGPMIALGAFFLCFVLVIGYCFLQLAWEAALALTRDIIIELTAVYHWIKSVPGKIKKRIEWYKYKKKNNVVTTSEMLKMSKRGKQ